MSITPPLPPGFGSDDLSRILLDVLKRKSEECASGEASLVLRRAHHIVQCEGCTNALCTGKYSSSGQQPKSNNNNASQPSPSDCVSVSKEDTCAEIKSSREVSDNNKNSKTTRGKDSKEIEVTNGEASNRSKVTNGEPSNQSKVTNRESSNLKRRLDANKNSKSVHVQKKKRSDNSDEKTKHKEDHSVLIGPSFWRQPQEILLRTPSRESESSTESAKCFLFHGRYVTVKGEPLDIPFAYDSRPSPIIDPRRVNHSSPPRQVIQYDRDTDS